jgi:hypothetical protein
MKRNLFNHPIYYFPNRRRIRIKTNLYELVKAIEEEIRDEEEELTTLVILDLIKRNKLKYLKKNKTKKLSF